MLFTTGSGAVLAAAVYAQLAGRAAAIRGAADIDAAVGAAVYRAGCVGLGCVAALVTGAGRSLIARNGLAALAGAAAEAGRAAVVVTRTCTLRAHPIRTTGVEDGAADVAKEAVAGLRAQLTRGDSAAASLIGSLAVVAVAAVPSAAAGGTLDAGTATDPSPAGAEESEPNQPHDLGACFFHVRPCCRGFFPELQRGRRCGEHTLKASRGILCCAEIATLRAAVRQAAGR